jgi:hypothetical protein
MNLSEKDEALRTEIYWEEFSNIMIEDFEHAIHMAISECKFFPKPSELYEFLNPPEKIYLDYETRTNELEWMHPTEEGRQIAKTYLKKIMDMLDSKNKANKNLEGEKARAFEEKRKKLKRQISNVMKESKK